MTESLPGANARSYQAKSTPGQSLDMYEITAEGVLRHREWNSEEGLGGKWIGHPDFEAWRRRERLRLETLNTPIPPT